MKKIGRYGLTGFLMLGSWVQIAQAIPAFARKYLTSCSTCHVAIPKLTAFGESFRLNGYQIPEGDEKYLKDKPVSLGAEPWKEVWPDAIWPGAIPGSFPLSAYIFSDVNAPLKGHKKEVEFDFPNKVGLLMGGVLGEDIPFFSTIEWGAGAVDAAAWMGFYNLFNSNRALNLKVGAFDFNPLPMAFDALRLGKQNYLYTNWSVPGSSNTFSLGDGLVGMELNGIVGSRFSYSAGIVNPKGGLDGYGTLRFKWGGTPYDRSAPTEEAADKAVTARPTGFWVDNSFEVAGFAYFGRANAGEDATDRFKRFGMGTRWKYENLDFNAAYVVGNNKNPYGTGETVDSQAWHVEANYFLWPWLIAEARVEGLKVDGKNASSTKLIDQKDGVIGLVWMIRANIKLITEATLFNQGSGNTNVFNMRLVFGF